MGVGKTKTVIDTAELMFSQKIIRTIIVICPLSIVDVWCGEKGELALHSSYSVWSALIGVKKNRIFHLDTYIKNRLNWYVINAEGLATIEKEFSQKIFDMAIVDESTTIKNRMAQRSKLVVKLFQKVPYKIIMSGNPTPKSPDEIFSQYLFAEPGIFGTNYTKFRDEYFITDYFNKIIGYKEKEEFERKFHSIAFRKTKQECLDLPPKVYQAIHIPMHAEQQKIYDKMFKDAIAYYEDKTCAAPVVITKMLRLSQIAGGFFPLEEGSKAIALKINPKIERLLEIIQEVPIEEQIVVWARFRKEVELIFERLSKEGISSVKFYGAVSTKERIKSRELFKNKEVRVFIGNPATGGKGINDLVNATTVIYYSNDYSAENRTQSEDRNHRRGTIKVTYVDLVMKDSIDEEVLTVLRSDRDFSEALLNRSVTFSKIKEK